MARNAPAIRQNKRLREINAELLAALQNALASLVAFGGDPDNRPDADQIQVVLLKQIRAAIARATASPKPE